MGGAINLQVGVMVVVAETEFAVAREAKAMRIMLYF